MSSSGSNLVAIMPTEITAQILEELDNFHDVVRCMRVCKNFAEIIDHSHACQRTLYLEPTTSEQYLTFSKHEIPEQPKLQRVNATSQPYIVDAAKASLKDRKILALNPAFQKLSHQYPSDGQLVQLAPGVELLNIRADADLLHIWRTNNSRWLQMQISRPALTEIRPLSNDISSRKQPLLRAEGVRLADIMGSSRLRSGGGGYFERTNRAPDMPTTRLSFAALNCILEEARWVRSARLLASAQPRSKLGVSIVWDAYSKVWKESAWWIEEKEDQKNREVVPFVGGGSKGWKSRWTKRRVSMKMRWRIKM